MAAAARQGGITAALRIQELVVEPARVLDCSHVGVIVGGDEVNSGGHVGVSAAAKMRRGNVEYEEEGGSEGGGCAGLRCGEVVYVSALVQRRSTLVVEYEAGGEGGLDSSGRCVQLRWGGVGGWVGDEGSVRRGGGGNGGGGAPVPK